ALMKDNRSAEISRLIGRSLRSVVDMEKLGKHTITIDCDVIQADGGTRCASITGAFVSLNLAVRWLMARGRIAENPVLDSVAAVSAGVWQGNLILDLDYEEDCVAEMDANFVVSGSGKFVEIQATGEQHPFDAAQLSELMALAQNGCQKLIDLQNQVLE
ncbi:MAG: ribonuclease PH, partial [Alphaproteobacteria bacterium]|nr:ribonuclease PH [Alphaproteobacteria bacterium]